MAMAVKVVAYTTFSPWALEEIGYISQEDRVECEGRMAPDDNDAYERWFAEAYPHPCDELAEVAGRRCYNSWDRPNPKTASNRDYLANIIDQQHESIFGHAHVTFSVTGVSRALLLELERHQQHMNLNFSVVSQRYVDHSDAEIVIPPVLEPYLDDPLHPDSEPFNDWTVRDEIEAISDNCRDAYGWLSKFLESKGHTTKEIRGAARAVLPEGTETQFLVTGSIRAWRDVIRKRATKYADEEIRNFALAVLRGLEQVAPNSVQDLSQHYHTEGEK